MKFYLIVARGKRQGFPIPITVDRGEPPRGPAPLMRGAGVGVAAVIEGDHVGRTEVIEELPVEPGDSRRGDQVDAQLETLDREKVNQQNARQAAKQGQVDRTDALAVAQDQFSHGACRDAPHKR